MAQVIIPYDEYQMLLRNKEDLENLNRILKEMHKVNIDNSPKYLGPSANIIIKKQDLIKLLGYKPNAQVDIYIRDN